MNYLALFPGLPTIQCLIACSIQKRRGKVSIIYGVNDVNVYLGRQTDGGAFKQNSAFEAFSCSVNSCVGVPIVVHLNSHTRCLSTVPSNFCYPEYTCTKERNFK